MTSTQAGPHPHGRRSYTGRTQNAQFAFLESVQLFGKSLAAESACPGVQFYRVIRRIFLSGHLE